MENRILYEDNHLLIINKLKGEIVQGDKTGDICLVDKVKLFLKQKYNKPGNVFAGLVHRLDRPVSGAVIFAKTGKALARMNKLLQDKKIVKVYHAICAEKPIFDQGRLINHLHRDESRNKSFVKSHPTANTKEAILDYKIIGKSDKFFLIEVNLITGRHHQIRAQLSHMNCPIKGDLKYGYPRSNPDGGIDLHAYKIDFIHPVADKDVSVIASYPDSGVWKFFDVN